MSFKVLTHDEAWGQGLRVLVVEERRDGKRYRAKPCEFVEWPAGTVLPLGEGFTVGDDGYAVVSDAGREFLRAALNAAWEIGLRPDGFDDTRESMRATNKHLEDMRAIAFHKIGAPTPSPKE